MAKLRPLILLMLALAGFSAAARAGDTIILDADLRESARQLFHGHEVIPVQPGPLTLYYPKWIPGEHSPSGPLENLAGLKIRADALNHLEEIFVRNLVPRHRVHERQP